MIQNLEFHAVHTELNADLKDYIKQKIGNLDKYVPASARRSLHFEVYAKENKKHAPKQFEFEVVAHLPKETIRIRESTVNMHAAVDIVELKLKQALIRYKDTHANPKRWRHLLKRARRQDRNKE